MTQAIRYTRDDGDSVVKESLSTAADNQNYRGAQYRPLIIGPLPILYTLSRELPLPDRRGNCQEMLDSSRRKARAEKRWSSEQFATWRVANSIAAARKATAEKSSAAQSKGESGVIDHFRGITKMVESGNNRRRHHDGR